MVENNHQKPNLKLVIMGMENAGKTTIVDIIIKESLEDFSTPPDMDPTKNVKRTQLKISDKDIIIWDFGGQELYRNEYLVNPEIYFNNISYFFFVLDVQDYYRFISSYMYFMGIFQLIRKFNPDAKLIILFHKMDPEFDLTKKNLKAKFLEKIEPFLKLHKKPFKTYDTTIFNIDSIKMVFEQEI